MPSKARELKPKVVLTSESVQQQLAELRQAKARLEHTEAELREALSGFQLAADGSMAGIYIFQDGKFSYVNPAFAEIFGLDKQRILAELLPEDLAHPDDRSKLMEFIRRRLSGETASVRFLYRGVRADGSTVHCEEFGRAVQLNGRPAIVGTVLDVTAREEAQESLVESEALFRGVAEKAPTMILILQGGRVVYANPASEAILEYRRTDLLASEFDYLRVSAPAWTGELKQRLEQQLAGGEVEPFEFQVVRRDGRLADVLQISRLINYQGKVAILLIVSDVTAHKRSEQERDSLLLAEQQQRLLAETLATEREFFKMKEELVLSVSHSLRTRLNTLKGDLELLRSGKVREQEGEAEFLTNALASAQRIEQIVDELLEATQLQSETTLTRLENVPVGELVGSSLESLPGPAPSRAETGPIIATRPAPRIENS